MPLPTPSAGGPVEGLGRGGEDGVHALVGEVVPAEGELIHADGIGELAHVSFAGEVVGGRCQAAVRALAQGRVAAVEADVAVGHLVGGANPGAAGVVIVELPGGQRSVAVDARGDLDDAGRTKVRPGELLLAGPHEPHRTTGGARQAGGLDGGLPGVLAAVAGAGVRHDDADVALRQPERLGELRAHAEGALRAGPDGQAPVLPASQGGARLQRRVRDVGDGVAAVTALDGRRHSGVDGSGAVGAAPAAF